MVVLKLVIVLLVIVVGGYMIFQNGLTINWHPVNEAGVHAFMPNGFSGVMAAVSGVFFAYIGFDAVSVLAEESKTSTRSATGMILSLIICTTIYIVLALVLTGAVVYSKFENVGDPLAFILNPESEHWMDADACFDMCCYCNDKRMLVFQMGQRIWMSMSRDGLLPPVFEKIHHKYQTPSFSTIITGLIVGIPILFTDKTFVLVFTSIATLFAFVLVCGGVLLISTKKNCRASSTCLISIQDSLPFTCYCSVGYCLVIK
jgi:amino acid transporter